MYKYMIYRRVKEMKSTRVSLNENVIQGYHDIEIHGVSNVNSEIDEKEVQFNP